MIPSPFHGIFSSSVDEEESIVNEKSMAPTAQASAQKVPPTIARGQGQVALDIFEYENYYIIKAPIAGVKMSDLDIEIADNTITIRGSRKQTDTVPDNQYYIQECFWGDFSRTVTLPCSIDQRKVKATFNKESILKILVPKEEKVKIIQISE